MVTVTRGRLVALVIAGGAAAGLLVFGILVARAVEVEEVDAPEALRRFGAVRRAIRDPTPLLSLDASGRVVRRRDPPSASPGRITRLGVVAYQAGARRLVTADVPFWFFKLKGPAAQIAVRGTGLDLEYLGITAADLERHGPALIIDHTRQDGDRLLVWTE
jgi:hypothetical protein